MASSKDQAIDLKNAYVKGIIDASVPQKLGMEVESPVASVHYDLNENLVHRTNDNDPTIYITNGYDEYPGRPHTKSILSETPWAHANPVMEGGVGGTTPIGARDTDVLNKQGVDDAIRLWAETSKPGKQTYRQPRFSIPGMPVN